MDKNLFLQQLKNKNIDKEIIKKIADNIYDYVHKNNFSINHAIGLLEKLNNLEMMLKSASFKVNSKGLVQLTNFPKLIVTFFDELNMLNIYNLEQTQINEVVKYLNGKLLAINEQTYFDKKIFKRIFYNIKNSKVKLSTNYKITCERLEYNIVFKIDTNNENKEKFEVVFYKNILYKEDFETSKWNFYYWTLNDFVTELKACNKWWKSKQLKK